MKPRTLFIGTPCHDSRIHKNYHASMVTLANCGKYNLRTLAISGGGVSIARNKLTAGFLKSDAPRILFVDGDISFTVADVDALWSRDIPIIGGLYAHKTAEALRWSARTAGKDQDDTGLVEVAAIGTGFLMIKREVFESIAAGVPEDSFIEDWSDGKGERRHAFFQERVITDPAAGFSTPTLLTEDWYFAYRARQQGYGVFADARVIVSHWEGGLCFPLPHLLPKGDA